MNNDDLKSILYGMAYCILGIVGSVALLTIILDFARGPGVP
jgi:hypothetical protein